MTQITKLQGGLFILLTIFLMSWQWPQKMIKGQIVDPKSGMKVEGAIVKLYADDQLFETISDEEGSFSFKDLEIGNYDVEISKNGYEVAHVKDLEVYKTQPTYLMIKMKKKMSNVFLLLKGE